MLNYCVTIRLLQPHGCVGGPLANNHHDNMCASICHVLSPRPFRYNMTPSTVFRGTKLVTPDDSYHFFSDLYDLGNAMTGGRFNTYAMR